MSYREITARRYVDIAHDYLDKMKDEGLSPFDISIICALTFTRGCKEYGMAKEEAMEMVARSYEIEKLGKIN